MATLYDVCKKTGLSTATVSRVINDSGLVKEETRERVLQAMKELNYRPSQAARKLAGGKTDTIGVVLPLLDNGYYVQVLRGIDNVSTETKLKLLISFYHSESDLYEILSSLGREGRTDAVILMNNEYFTPTRVRELTGDELPIALIGQEHESEEAMDSILIDNVRGAYQAVEYLLARRPKSLLLLTGPQGNHDSDERLEGAQQAVRDAPYDPEVSIVIGDFYHEGGRKMLEEHLRNNGCFPETVFAFNDAMALGVLDVIEDAGLRIPEDIQVIGFDNIEIAQYIGLSTVGFPMQRIGSEAARLVTERIKHNDTEPIRVTLETSLIARKTTD